MTKVLIVEDEADIREFLVDQFQDAKWEALGLENGNEIIRNIENFCPSIVILDQIMPGKSGHQIIREIRAHTQFSEIPIMILTGMNSEAEKIAALELGADDYVTKPFSPREIIVRSQGLVRRSSNSKRKHAQKMEIRDLSVDLLAHRVMHRGVEVPLTLTEFKILCELIRQSGQVLTRDRLRERALGNLNVSDRTIDVHMAALRKKLDSMGDQIETVRGVGYRLSM